MESNDIIVDKSVNINDKQVNNKEISWRQSIALPVKTESKKKKKKNTNQIKNGKIEKNQKNQKNNNDKIINDHLSLEELEKELLELLKKGKYEEVINYICTSTSLKEKYPITDVVKLIVDSKQFNLAGKCIRNFKLDEIDPAIVTFFIKELLSDSQLQLAVLYAKELIPNFLNLPIEINSSWTPYLLIKAMIRSKNYHFALKYANEFNLLELFPPVNLISELIRNNLYYEAFKATKEYKLENNFSILNLIESMLNKKQWSNAINCINKDKNAKDIYTPFVIATYMIHKLDFISAIKYIKDNKLDNDMKDENNINKDKSIVLLLVDTLISSGEFYKALKYMIKYKLFVYFPEKYNVVTIIQLAIQNGKYNLAKNYIIKLKLHNQFKEVLPIINKIIRKETEQFRLLLKKRNDYFHTTLYQDNYIALLDLNKENEQKESQELQEIEESKDIIISEKRDIIIRKNKMIKKTSAKGKKVKVPIENLRIEDVEA